ncbi:serine hydrolase domain-containing protein [Pendulispora albinea]|uniref:Beta-lactamase family protein n=1 Tax=Pendulispora albinea TaxID=2741071 RepID=A0ABZ2LLB1_9BACT
MHRRARSQRSHVYVRMVIGLAMGVSLTWACDAPSSGSISEETGTAPVALEDELGTDAPADPSDRPTSDAEIVRDLRALLARLVAEDRFSGTVLFAKHGQPLFAQAHGWSARAFNAKITMGTKFNTASTAKLFTSTSILQLAGEGKLSLDDTLSAVLPAYPNPAIARKVTIRQLLAMTSGMGDYVNMKLVERNPDMLRTIEDHLPFFVDDPLRFEPGTQQSYSNAGFMILGLVIERVSGQRFEEYVRTHIFEPAGMVDSGHYTSQDDIPNLALNYTSFTDPDGPRVVALRLGRGAAPAGGGGTHTTVGDLLRFAQAIRAGKLLDRTHTDLLMQYRPTEMWHLYGWDQTYVNGIHITGHGGATMGTSAAFSMYPDLGYTVAVLSNYDGAAMLVGSRLQARLTGEPSPRAVHVPDHVLQQFAGRYVEGGGGGAPTVPTIYITVEHGALVVSIPLQGKHKFLPLSTAEFFDDDMLTPRLTFTRDGNGAVTGLVLTGIRRDPTRASKRL